MCYTSDVKYLIILYGHTNSFSVYCVAVHGNEPFRSAAYSFNAILCRPCKQMLSSTLHSLFDFSSSHIIYLGLSCKTKQVVCFSIRSRTYNGTKLLFLLRAYKFASAMGEMEKNYIDVELYMSPTVHSHYIVHIDS